jgi:hypothetical protein
LAIFSVLGIAAVLLLVIILMFITVLPGLRAAWQGHIN